MTAKAPALGSEHLIIAALCCGGDAAEALAREGLTLDLARTRARAIAEDRQRLRNLPPGLRSVLRDGARTVAARGERWLDVNALVVAALADPEGGASRLLTAYGVDPSAIRRRLEGRPDALEPTAPDAITHQDAA